jgi:hypothetical protein
LGILVDTINYGLQINDVSQGRYPDGSITSSPVFMHIPTPGRANSIQEDGSGTFKIVGITISSTHVDISFQSEPEKSYQLQYLDSLSLTQWLNIGATIKATSNITTTIDKPGNNIHRYYRIVKITP